MPKRCLLTLPHNLPFKMKITRHQIVFSGILSLLLLWHSSVWGQVTLPTSMVPVDIEVPFVPVPVKALDKLNLVYEIHITNFSGIPLALTGIDVLSDNVRALPLASYRGDDVLKRIAVLNFTPTKQAKNVLGGGQRAVLFLLVRVAPVGVPLALRHHLIFTSVDSIKQEQAVDGGRMTVAREVPLAVGPPVRGRWLAGNGLSNDTGHRQSIKAVNGKACIAQRFATDWVKLGDDGLLARNGDMSLNANYYGYGAEVLAVAAGTVVAVKDGLAENVPQTKKWAVPITLETTAGNHVLLDLGSGHFALYAHLQPQSLKVKIGDKVRSGEVLGLVGNSGKSDLPHLHFHVVNSASPLGAEGIPYVLKSFLMQGTIKSTAEIVKGGFKPEAKDENKRQMEIPVQNAVVLFQ
jgi:murein DD-endopeptidase